MKNLLFRSYGVMKYHAVLTMSNSNQNNIETETKWKSPTHIWATAHFPAILKLLAFLFTLVTIKTMISLKWNSQISGASENRTHLLTIAARNTKYMTQVHTVATIHANVIRVFCPRLVNTVTFTYHRSTWIRYQSKSDNLINDCLNRTSVRYCFSVYINRQNGIKFLFQEQLHKDQKTIRPTLVSF
jgi:hypothetical protein